MTRAAALISGTGTIWTGLAASAAGGAAAVAVAGDDKAYNMQLEK